MIHTSPGVATPGVAVVGGGNGAGDLYPNRPGGMTLLMNYNGTSTTSPSAIGTGSSVQADGAIVNPLGSGSSIRLDYTAGNTWGGNLPVIDWGGNWQKLYISYRLYIDPTWDEAYGGKLFYVFQNGGSSTTAYYYTRAAGYDTAFYGQDNLGQPTHIIAGGFWARGTWLNIEILLEAETIYNTTDDARVRVWRNGVADATGVGVMGRLNGVEWYLTRNNAHTQNEYMLIGEFAAWGGV